MNNMIEIGKIVNVHGLKGEVKIVPWLDFPEMFEVFDNDSFTENYWWLENGQWLTRNI